jgi:hypothetical protein
MERIYTIDGINGKEICTESASRCLLDYVRGYFVFGWTIEPCLQVRFYENGSWKDTLVPREKFSDHLVYHRGWGGYFLDFNVPPREIVAAKYVKEPGYPYSFSKRYEAIENFNIFEGKQSIIDHKEFPISKYFKYTFGLEFETNTGVIPEDLCFRDGLIPLRDGSIAGNEYSTVVLDGNNGFNLLYQQIKTLREYTRFDKECSLHIHMGGFPLVPEKILSLYNLCYILQAELRTALPEYTFYTSRYKSSGKDYCKLLPGGFDTFDAFYRAFTTVKFFGDLQQGHPHDVERSRKWQIHERYYWANLLNLICYKVNKTMEFRMLRPTYNLEKILFWMYVFNAIMQYAEHHSVIKGSKIRLEEVLSDIYPADLVKELMIDFYKCDVCSHEQSKYGDYIGARMDIEEEFFDKDKII